MADVLVTIISMNMVIRKLMNQMCKNDSLLALLGKLKFFLISNPCGYFF